MKRAQTLSTSSNQKSKPQHSLSEKSRAPDLSLPPTLPVPLIDDNDSSSEEDSQMMTRSMVMKNNQKVSMKSKPIKK